VSGIGVATAIWGWAGLTGVQALFLAAPWFYVFFKIAGASYLVVTGFRLILNSRGPAATRTRPISQGPISSSPISQGPTSLGRTFSARAGFRIGLVTCLANPRSALSVASIFAAALPAHPSATLGAFAVALMVVISVTWYTCVAYLFTTGFMAAAYDRLRRWIDRTAGVLLIWFGAKLALDRT
jgi:threonine/homoserine/homoserine lactone efflux protein